MSFERVCATCPLEKLGPDRVRGIEQLIVQIAFDPSDPEELAVTNTMPDSGILIAAATSPQPNCNDINRIIPKPALKVPPQSIPLGDRYSRPPSFSYDTCVYVRWLGRLAEASSPLTEDAEPKVLWV